MAPFDHQSSFPFEIMDAIIDIVFSSAISASELSSLVQASRRFRHHVYARRFSKITIHSQRPNHLKKLARLLDCGVWPPQDALQCYTRSLTLVLGIPRTNIPEIEFDIKKFEAISTILRRVFIHDQVEPFPGVRDSLTILTESPSQRLGARHWGLQFDIMLGPIVTSTLEDLCHSSCIKELHLDNIWNVPPSLIYTSRTTLLHLVNVHFNDKIGRKADMAMLPRGNIQNLRIQNSGSFPSPTSFFDVVWKYTDRHSFQFTLKVFEIWVGVREDFKALSCLCGEIDTLIIHSARYAYAYPGAVNYSHTQILKCIEIIQDMRLCLQFVDSDAEEDEDWPLHPSPGTPTFLRIFHMLPPVLPPVLLVNMKIEITWCDPFANSREALDELYSALYDPSLLDYLQQSNLGENRRADFNLDINISLQQNDMDEEYGSRKQEYEDYMYHLLKSLVSINGVGVTSTVTFTVDP